MYVSSNNVDVDVGGSTSVTMHVIPETASDPSFSVSSSDSDIATIDGAGTIRGIAKGTTTMTVTSTDGGYSQTITVNVIQRVTSIDVSPSTKTIDEGESFSLTVTVSPSNANNKNYSFSIGSTSIVSFVSGTTFIGLSKGSTTITAISSDNSSITDSCSVTVLRRVTGMYISKSQTTLDIGQTETITAHVVPETASNTNYTWSTSNSSVATISNGVITAVGKGTATITATSQDGGYTATCTVTVLKRVTGISVSPTSTILPLGTDENITISVTPSDASDTSYSTTYSTSGIATISNGKIVPVSEGTTTITFTTTDGSFTATCQVEVVSASGKNNLRIGTITPTSVKVGTTNIKKIYVGNTLIYFKP